MSPMYDPRRLPVALALALGLALGLAAAAPAQTPGISSGSGTGTGTGTSAGSGLGTTGTGAESASGTRNPDVMRGRLPGGYLPGRGAAGTGRGGVLESLRESDLGRPMSGTDVSPEEIAAIDARLLDQARRIVDPAERALALERVARTKIFGRKLGEAHTALVEAAAAAIQVPAPTLRDRRIVAVVGTMLNLADDQVREGILPEDATAAAGGSELPPPAEGRPADRATWLDRAAEEWERALALSWRIGNPNFRGQMLSRVTEAQAAGASQMADEGRKAEGAPSERTRGEDSLTARAERTLRHAAAQAARIDRMVWRDNALAALASKAAVSGRFVPGLEAARIVGRPEIRVDALLRVAEAQARRDLQQDATATYTEAARAVASIALDDPRLVLGGILIDSLIASGRFDDARASVPMLPSPSRRLTALGAIAESQGRRGLADSALAWIERDAPPDSRPLLRRRVADGMLATVEQYRTKTLATERAR